MNNIQAVRADDAFPNGLQQHYLEEIQNRLPVVKRVLFSAGTQSIEEYLHRLGPQDVKAYQSHQDVAEAVYEYAAPLLGDETASLARDELIKSPMVLTANHHGIDYFAQSVQSTLLFSQRRLADGTQAKTVPVFACGNVPINNLTYPRGALVYDHPDQDLSRRPAKLPLFPGRLRRELVARVPGFDEPMVCRLLNRVKQEIRQNPDSHSLHILAEILSGIYQSPAVLGTKSYSDQAVLVNHSIWQRLFADSSCAPKLLYLELEKIASLLLLKDIANPSSLFSLFFFASRVRSQLLACLDKVKGCWQQEYLQARWHHRDDFSSRNAEASGTFLFWGVDEGGNRIALEFYEDSSQGPLLRGVSDKGDEYIVRLSPLAIADELQRGNLIPSVFTCLFILTFARGVNCIGGYHQADYLSTIQTRIIESLKTLPEYQYLISYISSVPTQSYLSGMQTVMFSKTFDKIEPAGPLEIIAGGGLTVPELRKMLKLSIQDAHIASLFETIPEVAPDLLGNDKDWWGTLSRQCANERPPHLVVKNY